MVPIIFVCNPLVDLNLSFFSSNSSSNSLEDLLFLLSPHLLSKQAQYLLQYLLTKHKIHRKHPETLFFASLPFYEFAVFNKIVESLPMSETTRLVASNFQLIPV